VRAILEGWRIALDASQGRKVRTPQGATPRNPPFAGGIHSGRTLQSVFTESATENKTAPSGLPPDGARVKRWGKSPPPFAQSKGHGKPRRVQGQIGNSGAARSEAQAGFRVSAAQTNDSLRPIRGADRIRLTALPKSPRVGFTAKVYPVSRGAHPPSPRRLWRTRRRKDAEEGKGRQAGSRAVAQGA
jgi:hypothetical protein